MESFMKEFLSSLLVVNSESNAKNSSNTSFLHRAVVRGDSDHFCKGDIIIPLKSPKIVDVVENNKKCLLYQCLIDPSDESLTNVREVLLSMNIPVERIYFEKNLLCFILRRREMIRLALETVLEAGQEYGKSNLLQSKKVSIMHDTSWVGTGPADLCRGHVVLNHIVRKLKFAGAEVQMTHYNERSPDTLDAGANICELRNTVADIENRTVLPACSSQQEMKTDIKGNQMNICFKSSGKSMIVDDVHHGEVFKYKHLISSKTGKAWRASTNDLTEILFGELRAAMELKYGDIRSEEGNLFLRKQAVQCMTLQLLSKTYSDNLRVDVTENSQNTKDWAFVLYNYARLKMIFKSYGAQVTDGSLPSLPDVKNVDFSLLKNDEEWVLVWEYIIRWPEVIEEFALTVLMDPTKIKTSALAKFLHTLSHRFSVYYRRYRVLVSGEFPHLIPLMHARLYLLKSLQIIMDICFDLMGVDSPPECM